MTLEELKLECIKKKIPILRDESLTLLVSILKENNFINLLEIGSALGYTALYLASLGYKITSLENNLARYNECLKNKDLISNTDVEFIYADAKEYKSNKEFDLIFIDGAKGHYQEFFDNFEKNLTSNGVFFIDNINFKDTTVKRFKTIKKRISLFYQKLLSNKNYTTKYIEIDDGVLIAYKK